MLRKNKKGSALDLIFIGVILLFFAVVLLVGFKVSSEFNTQVQSQAGMPTEARTASSTLVGYYPGVIDNMFLLLSIGLAIAVLILAALVRIHPIFVPLYIISLIFFIFLSGVFSNIYQEMAASPELATEAAQLVITSHILEYLPLIIGIIGTILMVIQYKTWKMNVS